MPIPGYDEFPEEMKLKNIKKDKIAGKWEQSLFSLGIQNDQKSEKNNYII